MVLGVYRLLGERWQGLLAIRDRFESGRRIAVAAQFL
jgi:hypothetical protein